MTFKVQLAMLVLASVAASISGEHYGGGYEKHGHHDYSAPAKYSYVYKVQDDYAKANFGHKETRDYDTTKGQYYVALPDGRLQKVSYYVNGKSGFVADVSYVGEAKHPQVHKGYSGYH